MRKVDVYFQASETFLFKKERHLVCPEANLDSIKQLYTRKCRPTIKQTASQNGKVSFPSPETFKSGSGTKPQEEGSKS